MASSVQATAAPVPASASSQVGRPGVARLDTTNACRQFGTQQTGISRLVRDTADGCQPQIDGSGRVMALLEVDAGSAAALQDRDARRDLPSIRFMSTPAKNSKFNANASGIAVRSFTP
jgi:hypothetical protein